MCSYLKVSDPYLRNISHDGIFINSIPLFACTHKQLQTVVFNLNTEFVYPRFHSLVNSINFVTASSLHSKCDRTEPVARLVNFPVQI